MIEVTVNLLPQGIKDKKRLLGIMNIINNGTGTQEIGNYDAYIIHEGKGNMYEVRGFLRQKNDVWDLIQEVLEKRR